MTPRTQRDRIVGALCALCTGGTLALFALGPDRFWLAEQFLLWELRAKDMLLANFSNLQPDPRLVFVGIDQPSYVDVLNPEELLANPVLAGTTNTFPWPR